MKTLEKLELKRSQVFTHRGLEPSKPNFYPESSFEAFQDQLSRGFGIEFDPNFVQDGIVVSHDATLKRITGGKDTRDFHDITVGQVTSIMYGEKKPGHIPTFEEVLELIAKSPSVLNALHLKGKFQEPQYLDRLLDVLNSHKQILDRILIFDAKPETAKYLKRRIPNLHIAPSVALDYDIKRYNGAVLGTLITVDDAIKYYKQGLYDWVWLDEWDLTDENGNAKELYTQEVFDKLHTAGLKVALVTPELHGTSPGLLGGEAHQDAANKDKLFKRIQRIISYGPDAICTDYPDETAQRN